MSTKGKRLNVTRTAVPANKRTDKTLPSNPQPRNKASDLEPIKKQTEPNRDELIDSFVNIALGEVGVKEMPTNTGSRIIEYQRATWLDGTGWAWCAGFVCWVFQRWQEKHGKKIIPINRPRTAGAFDFENWADAEGLGVKHPPSQIKRGDIVIFRFSHIGIAVGDQRGDTFESVEGNTNDAGSREGDGVYKKVRNISSVRSFIRLV